MKRLLAGLTLVAASTLGAQDTAKVRSFRGAPDTTVSDFSRPLPENAIVNFADTIKVSRKQDGSCDWSVARVRPGNVGSRSFATEGHLSSCSGVVYNITTNPDARFFLLPRGVKGEELNFKKDSVAKSDSARKKP